MVTAFYGSVASMVTRSGCEFGDVYFPESTKKPIYTYIIPMLYENKDRACFNLSRMRAVAELFILMPKRGTVMMICCVCLFIFIFIIFLYVPTLCVLWKVIKLKTRPRYGSKHKLAQVLNIKYIIVAVRKYSWLDASAKVFSKINV